MFLIRMLSLSILLAVSTAWPAVDVNVSPPTVTQRPEGEQFVQSVTFANEIAHYTLIYDVTRVPDKPDEVTSHWWAWTTKMVTLGMSAPSRANWYFQAFFNWYFDGESLYNRPATMEVIRQGGDDGAVEYTWDTPKAKATIRFAMTSGSDKLLLFARYEPKVEIKQSYLVLQCYPTGFDKPRNRAITTATRTVEVGGRAELDLEEERWVLFEDTTEGRPGDGSAGLLIGTPDAFANVSIPVGEYGITTRLNLKPEARSLALGLYSFPVLPEYEQTRQYFREGATREAEWLEAQATGELTKPLPPLPLADSRRAALREASAHLFGREVENWNVSEEPLDFPWARKLPGGPIKALVLAPRWCAYETMELGRRLEMDVEHLYFDQRDVLSNESSWPYRRQTGQGAIGTAAAAMHAADLCSNTQVELFLCAGVKASGIPGVARAAMLDHVRRGKGLLIVGSPDLLRGWPEDLFAEPLPGAGESVLAALPWEQIPGFRDGDPGRITKGVPLEMYDYGQGRVLVLRVALGKYSSLVPRNGVSEGLAGATDRCLALCARAARAAVGRLPTMDPSTGGPDSNSPLGVLAHVQKLPGARTLQVRMQDDLGRVLFERTLKLPLSKEELELPAGPAGRWRFFEGAILDANGACLDFGGRALPPVGEQRLKDLTIADGKRLDAAGVPVVPLPDGGTMRCSVSLDAKSKAPLARTQLQWEVRDAFDRLIASAKTPPPAAGGTAEVELRLGRPVTVCHRLDVSLHQGDRELAFERQRFTIPMSYPYDDFTICMWSYAGGEPVLHRTNRMCYDMGADMMDLCHMGAYSGAGAAREYELAARSGLRVLPYVTRLAGSTTPEHHRVPCMHDPGYTDKVRESLRATCLQAAPYSPVAFTLGDENYLFRGSGECCHRPESVEAFREWLRAKYGTIAKLNESWDTNHASFEAIDQPMLLDEAAKQTTSFAPWIDHKRFMDTAFAQTHELFAEAIRETVPGAKVGWDGLLGYGWQAGYDFTKLCANLELNQTYTSHPLQGELVRSLKRPDALTGKWGNAIADTEAGFSAWPWDCLFAGDNSVWWWTSWGCDYTPFNPDLSLSNFGKWFFPAAREVAHGPGKLLLHGKREHSGVGVLYSQPDLFVSAIMDKAVPGAPFSSTGRFLGQHKLLLNLIRDHGCQYQHIPYPALQEGEADLSQYRLIVLSFASCLSDAAIASLRQFVINGGVLLADSRAGLLDENGRVRESRPLDDLLGVTSPTGIEAVLAKPTTGEIELGTELAEYLAGHTTTTDAEATATVLEPRLRLSTGKAVLRVGDTPVYILNQVGQGRVVTLNFTQATSSGERTLDDHPLMHVLMSNPLAMARAKPPCELTRTDGVRPLCLHQVLFTDGNARYLAIQQDLLIRGLPEQSLHLKLPQPSIVYDMRTGQQVGTGPVSEWDAKITRGRPVLYALLPYEVGDLTARAPDTAKLGSTVKVTASVAPAQGAAGFHVVRMNVFAPGVKEPHRQYSQNLSCPGGRGEATIPFALSDATGEWRLEFRDVASGVKITRTVQVAPGKDGRDAKDSNGGRATPLA